MVRAGRVVDALETLREHAATTLALGDVDLSVNMIETFCLVFAEQEDASRAARMLDASRATRRGAEIPIAAPDAEWLEHSVRKVRDLPDPETWRTNVAAGSEFTLQDALYDALR